MHDFDPLGESDGGIDLDDFDGFTNCFAGPDVTPGGAGREPTGSRTATLTCTTRRRSRSASAAATRTLGDPNAADPACLAAFDADPLGVSDGMVGLADFDGLCTRLRGPGIPVTGDCPLISGESRFVGENGRLGSDARKSRAVPTTGTFALHGRPVDVLPDGKVLIDFRARTYDPQHARWLQRDPTGYADGGNLYEAFGSNASRFTDPKGCQSEDGSALDFLIEYFSPQAALDRLAFGSFWGSPGKQAVAAKLDHVTAVTADAARRAEPYVRPVVQTAGAVGGGFQMVIGGAIVVGSEGLGSPVGYVLVARSEDVLLTNVHGLYTGSVEPTTQWLAVNHLAGPEAASLSELAVDLGTLPASLNALPLRGPAPTFSSMRTFAGPADIAPLLTSANAPARLSDRALAAYCRAVQFVTGEERGYVLGSGLSPGEVGATRVYVGTPVMVEGRQVLSGQVRMGPAFSSEARVPSVLAGRNILEVAQELRTGQLSPDVLTLTLFEHEGQLVSANTRGVNALSLGRIETPVRYRIVVPRRAWRARLSGLRRETPLGPGLAMPGTSTPVTPSIRDRTILYIIQMGE